MADKKCAHELCNCQAREGSKYCSDSCEMSRGMTHLRCTCGHTECVTAETQREVPHTARA
jgi:hypothetical protein